MKKRGKFVPGGFSLLVKRSKAGLGLYAGEPIQKGACIIEYVGRTLSKKEEYTSRSLYLFEVSKSKMIDGSPRLNLGTARAPRINTAGYINHSCRPNAEVEIYKGRVYVMALRSIRPGEELAYDYGDEYFEDIIRAKGCQCAACKEGKGRTAKRPKAQDPRAQSK